MEKVYKFEDFFGNNPTVKVLDYLLSKKDFDFTLSHISDATVMSRTSARKAVGTLMILKLVMVTRKEGISTYYGLKKEHKKFQVLNNLNEALNK